MAASLALKKLLSSTTSPNASLRLVRSVVTSATTSPISPDRRSDVIDPFSSARRYACSFGGMPESFGHAGGMTWPRLAGLDELKGGGMGFAFSAHRPVVARPLARRFQVRAMSVGGRTGKPLKYNKYRKGRCSRGFKADGSYLSFGRYGIKCCENGRITSRAIEAARRAIMGQFKRKGKVWIRVLADIPVTKKPTEVRMGRGKGGVAGWIARVSTGQVLFEFDGVSLSDAQQAATLASHKICLPTKFMIYS